jgi:hypothetical protein
LRTSSGKIENLLGGVAHRCYALLFTLSEPVVIESESCDLAALKDSGFNEPAYEVVDRRTIDERVIQIEEGCTRVLIKGHWFHEERVTLTGGESAQNELNGG